LRERRSIPELEANQRPQSIAMFHVAATDGWSGTAFSVHASRWPNVTAYGPVARWLSQCSSRLHLGSMRIELTCFNQSQPRLSQTGLTKSRSQPVSPAMFARVLVVHRVVCKQLSKTVELTRLVRHARCVHDNASTTRVASIMRLITPSAASSIAHIEAGIVAVVETHFAPYRCRTMLSLRFVRVPCP
jgi:hypothetical protein